MIKPFILFLFICVPSYLFAQKNFLPGYYISSTGDSITCKIDFKDWDKNPESIEVELNSEKRKLTLDDINGFGIKGYSYYTKAKINYHINLISGNNLPEEFSDVTENRTVFFKILSKGTYLLYEWESKSRVYYYIQETGGELVELVYRVRQKNDEIFNDDRYKEYLRYLLEKDSLLDKNIKKLELTFYSGESIGKLVNILNNTNEKTTMTGLVRKPVELEIFSGAGLNYTPSEFDGYYAKNQKFDNSVSPNVGLRLLYFIPGRYSRLGLGISFGYSPYKTDRTVNDSFTVTTSPNFYYTTRYTEKFKLDISSIRSSLSVLYILNPLSMSKLYVKAGLLIMIPISSSRSVMDEYAGNTNGIRNGNIPFSYTSEGKTELFSVSNSWASINGGVGVVIKQFKFEFDYFTPTDIYQRSASTSGEFKAGVIGFNIYYNLLKK